MPSSKFVLVVTTNNDGGTTAGEIAAANVPGQTNTGGAGAWDTCQDIGEFIATEARLRGENIVMWDTTLQASTTFSISSSNMSNNDTWTLGIVVLTAVTGTPTSGQFKIGATALATAQNAAALINSISTLTGVVTASAAAGASSSGVVTVTSVVPGIVGNQIPMAKSSTNTTLANANLVGGTQSHFATISAGL